MSAGAFEQGKYQGDNDYIWRCKVQPETKGLVIDGQSNDYPALPYTAGLPRLTLQKGRHSSGVKPRYVVVELTADGSGTTAEYKKGTRHKIVVFNPLIFALYDLQATGTYLGIACRVVMKSGEASS